MRAFVTKAIDAIQKNLFPDDETIQETLVQSAGKITEDGVKLLSVTQVKEGKLEEALAVVYKEMSYYSDIEGFESSVEVWATSQEGLQALGMEAPQE
jgi:hypothetical protein